MTQMIHELRARQQITLTPRLQQSVKLLQMSTLDFSREVAQAIAENPFLEEPEESAAEDGSEQTRAFEKDEFALSATDEDAVAAIVEEGPAPTEQLEPAPDDPASYSGDYPTVRNHDQPNTDVGQWASSDTTMQDALRRNLCGYQLSERDSMLIEYIIEALDEDGYLRVDFDELAAEGEFSPPVQESEWEVALHLVQQLATPGLGARSLQECLALQLSALPEGTPHRDTALAIAQTDLEKLARCDYVALAELTRANEDDVREACALIRTLDPRPGANYASVDPSNYVVPDVLVRKVGHVWVAVSNQEAMPRARLNTAYAELFRHTRYTDRALMSQALQEARWLMRSLEQRNTTIQRVAQAIVARQQTYFEYGDVALRPLMLSEIAEELGMHESTISRATSNKYMSTPKGIVEFKHFFSRELSTRTGGTLSAVAVRALIQEMIDNEDPSEPLSDVALAQKLTQEGIVVARRTVSKYRAQIKYPAADLRRHA